MKKGKRILSLLLILTFVFLIFPVQSLGADIVKTGVCGDSVKWRLYNDGKLYIYGDGNMCDYSDPRTSLGKVHPWGKDDVTRVVIGEGVTGIGKYAFADHYQITDVEIPDSVTEIGEYVFQYCSSLTTLILPKRLKTIPKGMCVLSGLRCVYIPSSVSKIGGGAFYYSKLIEIIFKGSKSKFDKIEIGPGNDDLNKAQKYYNGGCKLTKAITGKCGEKAIFKLSKDGVLTISGSGKMDSYYGYLDEVSSYSDEHPLPTGDDHPWFKYRSLIKKIVIKSGITEIGEWAFFDCFNCREVQIEFGVKHIGKGAFAQTPVIKVSLPDSVKTIGSSAFSYCRAMRSIKLPSGLKSISSEMLCHCEKLQTLKLPSGLERIEQNALYSCYLDNIVFPASLTYINSSFGVENAEFLGSLPNTDVRETFAEFYLEYSLSPLKNCKCKSKYYQSFKDMFIKFGFETNLSTGDHILSFKKKSLVLDNKNSCEKLSCSFDKGKSSGLSKKWWVDDISVASINQNGVVSASGHGSTLAHAEVTDGSNYYMASCKVTTKRNDLMIKQLPVSLKTDFPVTCGTTVTSLDNEVSYRAGKLAERETNNPYYKNLKQFTNKLIKSASTDTEKAKAVFNWICKNVKYGGAIGIGNTADQAYSVFLNKEAHCEGFAKLTGFMLYLAGIPSCLIAGYGHMWNAALLDGKWTMIDSTNGEFGGDHNDYDAIEWIAFGEDEFCFVVYNTEDGVVLPGTGDHVMTEEREQYVSVIVPEYVKQVSFTAFEYCRNLKTVVLPKSVVKVHKNAFSNIGISKVYYKGTASQWKKAYSGSFNSVVFDNDPPVKRTIIPSAVKLSKVKYTYSGSVQRPSVSVKDSKGNTIPKTDYTVSYSNSSSKAAGEYKVTVKFKNNYCGTKTLKYKIIPHKVTGLKAAALKTTSVKLKWSKLPEAKAYKVEMSCNGGKTWKSISTVTTGAYTAKHLSPGMWYQFRVKALDSSKKTAGPVSSVLTVSTPAAAH